MLKQPLLSLEIPKPQKSLITRVQKCSSAVIREPLKKSKTSTTTRTSKICIFKLSTWVCYFSFISQPCSRNQLQLYGRLRHFTNFHLLDPNRSYKFHISRAKRLEILTRKSYSFPYLFKSTKVSDRHFISSKPSYGWKSWKTAGKFLQFLAVPREKRSELPN